ncbi:MAG: hypothetical protein WA857_16125, partial [Candidatus Acidiferrum sp.]
HENLLRAEIYALLSAGSSANPPPPSESRINVQLKRAINWMQAIWRSAACSHRRCFGGFAYLLATLILIAEREGARR